MAPIEVPVHVGVLSLHHSKETKAILNAVEALGHTPEWLRKENTAIHIRDDAVTLEPDVDVVINRLLLSRTEHPIEALCLANNIRSLCPMLNDPDDVLTALHKFTTATILATKGFPVPEASIALDYDRLNEERAGFGSSAVYKTAIGTHGGGTWLVSLDEQVTPMIDNRWAFLQEFIEVEGERHRDLRVYVVGNEVIAAMQRYAPDSDWRTNVVLGGETANMTAELPNEAAELALDTTATIGLDYAGIDLIEGNDGWYVLEANPTAGFKGLFKATGISPAPYIARLAIERAGGTVSQNHVEELSSALDDSVPACAPSKVEVPVEPPVIGYTQKVIVTGTSGSETVLAKSDTGANRTSIDTDLAAKIGADPVKNRIRVRTGSLKGGKTRSLVDVVVEVNGDRHTVTASIEDRSHMTHSLLLGRDILKHYHVDVRRRADS